MKASLETSALFLFTTLELINFVSPDLKFHCFLLPNLEIFQIIQKISSLAGNFPGYPETFKAIRKGLRAKTFRTRKNFPGSNATLLPRFLRLWLWIWIFRMIGSWFLIERWVLVIRLVREETNKQRGATSQLRYNTIYSLSLDGWFLINHFSFLVAT